MPPNDFTETALTQRWISNPWLTDSPASLHDVHQDLAFTARNSKTRQPSIGQHSSTLTLQQNFLPNGTQFTNQSPPYARPEVNYSSSRFSSSIYDDDPAFSSDLRDHPDFIMTENEEFVPAFNSTLLNPPVVRMPESPPALAIKAREEPLEATVGPQRSSDNPQKTAADVELKSSVHQSDIEAIAISSNKVPQSGNSDLSSITQADRLKRTTSALRTARPNDLDKVDALDDSDPYGLSYHHDGPYEAIPTPQAAAQQRLQQSRVKASPSYLSGTSQPSDPQTAGSHVPPSAIPYHINLKPGEVFSRSLLKPSRPINAPIQPTRNVNSLPGTTQGIHPLILQSYGSDTVLTRTPLSGQRPGQALSRPYSNPITSTHLLPSPGQLQSYSSNSSQSTSSKPSSKLRSGSPTRYHDPVSSAPATNQERFRAPNSGPEAPDISLPPISRSAASVREEGPSPLHRPKRLVMPAPLQTIQANVFAPSPQAGRSNSLHSTPLSNHSRANHVPIRENKGRNLLRKRSVIGNEVITRPEQALTSGYNTEPEAEKESRFSRKLSKRKF